MPPAYQLRAATLADAEALVAHRIGMFTDMGLDIDTGSISTAFRRWLDDAMPSGLYRAWVVESEAGEIAAGGGVAVVPWPPGPHDTTGKIAVIYNVYTAPAHRRRGLARLIMTRIHAWCREAGVRTVGLAASPFGRPLYESMGYRAPDDPYMFASLGAPTGAN